MSAICMLVKLNNLSNQLLCIIPATNIHIILPLPHTFSYRLG